jgi:ascorbate-specific PTS system EIIC-type component UlaA
VGLLFFVVGIVAMFYSVRTTLGAIQIERDFFPGPQPIIDPPAYAPFAMISFITGCILCLIGGLINKANLLRLPLVVLGIIYTLEIVVDHVIALFSPYPSYSDSMTFILIIVYALPGLLCIAEGVFLFCSAKNISR